MGNKCCFWQYPNFLLVGCPKMSYVKRIFWTPFPYCPAFCITFDTAYDKKSNPLPPTLFIDSSLEVLRSCFGVGSPHIKWCMDKNNVFVLSQTEIVANSIVAKCVLIVSLFQSHSEYIGTHCYSALIHY